MNKLEDIGFYTLYDKRAETASPQTQLKRCEMIITENCNFSCSYCRGLDGYIYGDRKVKQLSIEEIKRNIDLWCINEPLESIRFSGGEPTLHNGLFEAVVHAKSKGIKNVAVSTNGSRETELYSCLVGVGVNDFSISLDACCAEDADRMAGKDGIWENVSKNIEYLAKLVYVTVGVVLTPDNIGKTVDIVKFADGLGVSDIRLISSAQWNGDVIDTDTMPKDIVDKYPILKYRVDNFIKGRNVRGIEFTDSHYCSLALDDSVIAGEYHFPCIIYMREKGKPLGKIDEGQRGKKKSKEQCEAISKRLKGVPSPKKGKTYEEIYGPEKAKELRKAKVAQLKGKSYKEIYGEERAAEEAEKRGRGRKRSKK